MGVRVPLKAGAGIKAKYFFSHRYRVAGRVDYVVAGQGDYVPVEYKSARVRQPRDSDVFQVLTYCFLLQEGGHPVNRGRLKYRNGICAIPYGPGERQEVLHVVAEMRQAEKSSLQAIRGKHDHRCRGCAYKTICREENYKQAPRAGSAQSPRQLPYQVDDCMLP
jgi:CRISPR-associated protein Cas4